MTDPTTAAREKAHALLMRHYKYFHDAVETVAQEMLAAAPHKGADDGDV